MRPELIRATELLRLSTPAAVEEAIGLLQNTVYSFSMKVCGHPQDAEDTMQEVLYRSLGHLAKIENPKALAVWLYTVTRNRCWRMRLKPAGSPSTMLSLDALMPSDEELGLLLQDSARSPEDHALQSQQNDILQQAILRIPLSLRIVLVLHDMEELTTDEVGQVLGLKQGTVRVRLHRARLYARKEMNQLLAALAKQKNPQSSPQKAIPGKSKDKRRPTACRDLFANLSEYLDGRIEPRTCDQMREHIEACPSCVAFLRELRGAIDRCRSLSVPCDPAVTERLRSILTREYLRMLVPVPGK